MQRFMHYSLTIAKWPSAPWENPHRHATSAELKNTSVSPPLAVNPYSKLRETTPKDDKITSTYHFFLKKFGGLNISQ